MNESSTLTKVLNGINNTLNIVNKAMPIYKEAKPIINTLKNNYSKIKTVDIKKTINLLKLKNQLKKDYKNYSTINSIEYNNTTNSNINNPKFFI